MMLAAGECNAVKGQTAVSYERCCEWTVDGEQKEQEATTFQMANEKGVVKSSLVMCHLVIAGHLVVGLVSSLSQPLPFD